MTSYIARAAAFLALAAAPLGAQTTNAAADTRPQILILGTWHMGGSSDYLGGTPDNVLSARRQAEVAQLVELLARFRPTKIAVEVAPDREAALNGRYGRYVAGADTLTRNETDQIGFRLARRMGHARLYGIDYRLNEDVGAVVQWAAANGDTAFVRIIQEFGRWYAAQEDSARILPLLENFRRRNTPEYDALHSGYYRMARVGSGTEFVGAEVVANRYERNLKIFANLARIAEPGDRILVIYGSSHGKLLREFVRESPDLRLVDTLEYLRADGGTR